jgi:hypothetical protein
MVWWYIGRRTDGTFAFERPEQHGGRGPWPTHSPDDIWRGYGLTELLIILTASNRTGRTLKPIRGVIATPEFTKRFNDLLSEYRQKKTD